MEGYEDECEADRLDCSMIFLSVLGSEFSRKVHALGLYQ